MKLSDDYGSKYVLWIGRSEVVALPEFEGVPEFGSRKFGSYAEFNDWKRELIREIARRGGVKWKK